MQRRVSWESDTLFGHPRGMAVLFLTGMWEVFALFGMRTILVFYLVKELHFSAPAAVKLYGLSTATAFLLSFVGGIVGDRYLGLRRAVVLGALTLSLGHFLLISPMLLLPSLALIGVGAGLFKPCLAAQVWTLYPEGDSRRDRAIVLYKMGCNLGGIIGPIVCGALFEYWGWSSAVATCGVGMLVSAATFVAGRRHLPDENHLAARNKTIQSKLKLETRSALILIVVAFGAAIYWIISLQQGGTIALWTYEDIDRAIHFGHSSFKIPAAWFQSVNPILILLFTPGILWLWSTDGSTVDARIEIRRMTVGAVMLALSFLVLAAATATGRHPSWIWLTVALFPMTLSELYVDPMGQALFSRLAPTNYVSTFVSIWFLTLMIGYFASGWFGGIWVDIGHTPFFLVSAASALVSGLIFATVWRVRLSASVRETKG